MYKLRMGYGINKESVTPIACIEKFSQSMLDYLPFDHIPIVCYTAWVSTYFCILIYTEEIVINETFSWTKGSKEPQTVFYYVGLAFIYFFFEE